MKKIIAALLSVCCFISTFALSLTPVQAASNILPTVSNNLNVRLKSTSKLVATSSGYMRVFYDGQKVGVEYYDDSFNILSKKSIPMELKLWGGFYAGSDAYYLVEGQNNTNEDDSAEVIRVIQYDTNWNKKGTAKITGDPALFGGEVRYPFNYGCVEMTEYNGTLYIVTGHEGYVDPVYNQGHQGFLMIAVDEETMTGKIVDSDLSHSFAQYIDKKNADLYVLEQSEGARCTKLSKYNAENLNQTSIPILEYGGSRTSAWAISCYASVDGMALSADNVLCLGTSIDQSKYDNVSSDTAHNIYLTVTPVSDFSEGATTVKWLTNYSGDGKSFLGTKITKINDNRFLITWQEHATDQTASTNDTLSGSILHYVFVDGNGNQIGQEFTAVASISECQPIVKGSKVVYYASNDNMVNFYSIDAQTGQLSKKIYRVAGENATWALNQGVLTISGTGDIVVDPTAKYRYPVSSTAAAFTYSSSDNAWAPIRENVKKIVVNKGITSIPEREFAYFDNLQEVELPSTLKNIEKEAFYSCGSLSKITIPASVTNIGEDILWTGYYWKYDESHVVNATIYGNRNSTAEKYAKANGIRFVSIDVCQTHSWVKTGTTKATTSKNGKITYKCSVCGQTKTTTIYYPKTVTLSSTSYTYNGKAKKPSVTVKDSKGNKITASNYTVTYASGRKNVGTYTVTIKFKGNYSATVKKTFTIKPKATSISKLTAGKKKFTVKWKKQATQTTGYQIQYSTSSKFKSAKTVTVGKNKTTSKSISKLKAKKKYYVRIRTYKTVKVNGKSTKIYSSWSKAKAVTTKK